MEKVNFKSNNLNVVANMCFPENFEKNRKYSAIVVNHQQVALRRTNSRVICRKIS